MGKRVAKGYYMKRGMAALGGVVALTLALGGGCGSGKGKDGQLPEDFNSGPDSKRVAYMMEHASPDSVARFICLAALGKVSGARIDTLATASLYAYSNYSDSTLNVFSDEYERFIETRPLPDKMRLYAMAGTVDPQGLGLELGLRYADQIRANEMTPEEVEAELAEFRKAAGEETYGRFLKGFKVVLNYDAGRDIPAGIYQKYR